MTALRSSSVSVAGSPVVPQASTAADAAADQVGGEGAGGVEVDGAVTAQQGEQGHPDAGEQVCR